MGQLGVADLSDLRKVLRAFYRYRREPTQENNRKLEELRFLGAHHCPSCDAADVCRLMSTCGFVSKGSGGETVSKSAASSSCGGCSATSCAGCGH